MSQVNGEARNGHEVWSQTWAGSLLCNSSSATFPSFLCEPVPASRSVTRTRGYNDDLCLLRCPTPGQSSVNGDDGVVIAS